MFKAGNTVLELKLSRTSTESISYLASALAA